MVTGVNYLLETKKTKILIDCGLFQGSHQAEQLNQQKFPYSAKEIEAVLVTHAHLDHTGRLPQLVKAGFRGKIFCTPPTRDFVRLMFIDSQEVSRRTARESKQRPLFGKKDIEQTLNLFQDIEYGHEIKLNKEISFCFREAGHILGSAVIEVWAENKKIVFSGDLGNWPVPFLRPPDLIQEADYLLIEATYGDRLHEERNERRNILEDVIEETVVRNGVVLIPSFALERAQEILYELNNLIENQRIPQAPVFVDSPLAIKLTQIYRQHQKYFNQEAAYLLKSGDDIFNFPGLKMTSTVEESKEINQIAPPKIIIAGSGMSTGGRILHHELRYLSDPKSTLLIMCYQVEGTLGRQILDGAKEVEILGQKTPVNLQIRTISGYSAHPDQEALYNWIKSMRQTLKRVFVVQAEEKPSQALAQKIKDHLGLSAEVPKINQVVKLD